MHWVAKAFSVIMDETIILSASSFRVMLPIGLDCCIACLSAIRLLLESRLTVDLYLGAVVENLLGYRRTQALIQIQGWLTPKDA